MRAFLLATLFSVFAAVGVSVKCDHSHPQPTPTPTATPTPAPTPSPTPQPKVQEVWLFTHPTHLEWWILPNLEKYQPHPLPITGVFCVYVDTNANSQFTPERDQSLRARCAKLGLKFVHAARHSHQNWDDYALPMNADWQGAMVAQLGDRIKPGEPVMLDLEPYYRAQAGQRRYHRQEEYDALELACRPWSAFKGDVYVYPTAEAIAHARAIAHNAGGHAISLDARSYDTADRESIEALRTQVETSRKWAIANGIDYVPGFYLKYLKRSDVLKAVADQPAIWLFARTTPDHPDDLPHFGTPDWSPRK